VGVERHLGARGYAQAVIDRLHDEIVKVIRTPEFGQYLTGEAQPPSICKRGCSKCEVDQNDRVEI
jgi:hypothetical protein